MAEIIEALAAEGKGTMTESNMKKIASEMYSRAKKHHDDLVKACEKNIKE